MENGTIALILIPLLLSPVVLMIWMYNAGKKKSSKDPGKVIRRVQSTHDPETLRCRRKGVPETGSRNTDVHHAVSHSLFRVLRNHASRDRGRTNAQPDRSQSYGIRRRPQGTARDGRRRGRYSGSRRGFPTRRRRRRWKCAGYAPRRGCRIRCRCARGRPP